MARCWKERYDPEAHPDYMSSRWIGGLTGTREALPLVPQWVYCVHVCSFTFLFHSLDQLSTCLSHFEQTLHPSSRESGHSLEHYWQRWYERLPQHLFKAPKRQRVIRALQRALREFD